MQTYLRGIKSGMVRDLVWCLLSPCPVNDKSGIPIITDEEKYNWFIEHRQIIERWAGNDEIYRKTVNELLKNNRLGYYLEALLFAFFYLSPSFEVVLANHQIVSNKSTLGEIDLVLRRGEELLHIELSIKFYLQFKNSELLEDWLGPNAKDNFLKKRDKLIDQQLQMMKYIELENKDKLESKALICGQFYQRSNHLLDWQGKASQLRRYLYRHELLEYLSKNKVERVLLLKKPNWLSHQIIADEEFSLKVNSSLLDIIDKGHENKKAILLGLLLNDVYQTLFVVPNAWPKLP